MKISKVKILQVEVALTKVVEPKYFYEAMKNPLWQKSMAEAICTLEDNKT